MLAKKNRLTKRGSFSYLYSNGKRVNAAKLRLCFLPTKHGVRIGFSVSNKIGCAVERNKVRRRMRAVMRKYVSAMSPCQAVFLAGDGITTLSYAELERAIVTCLRRSGLIKESLLKKYVGSEETVLADSGSEHSGKIAE